MKKDAAQFNLANEWSVSVNKVNISAYFQVFNFALANGEYA